MKIPYTNVVPRLSCAEVGRIRSWQNITLTPPPGAGVDVTTLKLTVDTAAGTAVPGFVDLHPDASGAIDLSTLAVADSGTQPTFLVTVPGVTTTQAAQLTAAVTYTSDPPQICFTLTTRHNCPTLAPGLSAGPTVPADTLNLGGQSVATVSGVDTATPISATVSQADMSGCVGSLSGTATRTFTGGTAPIGGATLNLLAPDSTVVATTTTAADGSYSFANVNPAAYTIAMGNATQPVTVAAAAAAVASLDLPGHSPDGQRRHLSHPAEHGHHVRGVRHHRPGHLAGPRQHAALRPLDRQLRQHPGRRR